MIHRCAEHTVVMEIGSLLAVGVGVRTAPREVLLRLAVGVLLGVFARVFLDQRLGGELYRPCRHQ